MNIAQSGLGTVGGIEFGWYPQSRIEGAGSCNRMKDLRNGNADPEFHRFVSFDALEQQAWQPGGKGSTPAADAQGAGGFQPPLKQIITLKKTVAKILIHH